MKYKTILAILLIVIMIEVVGANNVIYSCCKNFTINPGTQLEDFEDISLFTLTGVNTIKENSIDLHLSGSNALKITAVNSEACVESAISANFSNSKNILIKMYVMNSTALKQIVLQFSSDKYFVTHYNMHFSTSGYLHNGWNLFLLNKSDFGKTGNESWDNNMVRMRLYVIPEESKNASVIFDDFRYNVTSRPKIIFTFDDNYKGQFENTTLMHKNGQRGVVFIVTGNVNKYPTERLTYAQLKILQSYGWDIASHNENHKRLTKVSIPTLISELQNAYNYLANNGFKRTASIFAYPNTDWNDVIISHLISSNYIMARLVEKGPWSPNLENISSNYLYKIPAVSIENTTTEKTITDKINDTIYRNGMLILVFHDISDTKIWQFSYKKSGLENISNYIASQSSEIDVATFSDYLITTIPTNTPLINKKVDIYSNGISLLNDTQTTDDITVNMLVSPNIDYVTVNVMKWTTTGNYVKVFNASSQNASTNITFTIGDLPANKTVTIKRDNIAYSMAMSNATGYITYYYNGGFGEHQFTVEVISPLPQTNAESYDTNGNGRIDKIEAIQAVIDYFNGTITKQDTINVVLAYFSG